MNVFLLPIVLSNCALTPKSTEEADTRLIDARENLKEARCDHFIQADLTEFDFRVVSQQNILPLNVPMNNFIAMKITKSSQYFARDIGYPLLLQALALG